MSRHLDKVLAHVERQLPSVGEARPTEVLPLYKKFLRIEEHRLRLEHKAGGGGREICARRVDLVDVLLRHAFAAASRFAEEQEKLTAKPLALLALGGYGRRELNPWSDVDVMFVHGQQSGKVAPYVTQVVEQVLYLLWDIGFKVGHSTRSVREAIDQAKHDMLTKTAMLEARFLTGDESVARLFRSRFRAECVKGSEQEYFQQRMEDQAARHAKYGDSVYMQEPHVKNGCGGLRDYQNLLWMTFFKEGALTTTHLVGKDWLSPTDQRRIETAYDFLLRVRTELHYVNGRATDVLHLNVQDQIAKRFHYRNKRGQLRSEALMKDYYAHTRNIFRVTERITEQFAHPGLSEGLRSFFGFRRRRRVAEKDLGDFVTRGEHLYARHADVFAREPELMMQVFGLAQEHGLQIGPDLEDLMTRNLHLVTRNFRTALVPREMFRAMLSRRGEAGRILRMMHRVDFLGRYLPEFEPLTCLVQHEFFHRYTADEHSLVCIEKLDALTTTNDGKLTPYRALFEKLGDPYVLYLALLLHDTGKAVGARPHSEASALFAQQAALRLELSSEERKALILLVDHHLTLSTIARQRNLDDPETIVELGGMIRSQENLDALMLLTLADGQGTSAEAWSDWKETLVWQLHRSTSQYLADQAGFFEQQKIERESLRNAVAEKLPPDFAGEVEAHFDAMPDNYFRAFSVEELAQHAQLFRQFLGNLFLRKLHPLTPAVAWEPSPRQGHTTVSLCTWDGQQLLAKIAGSFSVVPLNILSADIYTRGDNVVLDVFRVCDLKARAVTDVDDFALVESMLRHALAETDFDFSPLLEKARGRLRTSVPAELDFPTKVITDNKSHPLYTLIQIETQDRLGLLYDLLCALGDEGVAIILSRISTDKGAAIDTFYVADSQTRGKITEGGRLAALRQRLQEVAVGPLPTLKMAQGSSVV
ncbi:MAG: [protein-PII] uridylyltransferase [Chthoniobacterales bacterium]